MQMSVAERRGHILSKVVLKITPTYLLETE